MFSPHIRYDYTMKSLVAFGSVLLFIIIQDSIVSCRQIYANGDSISLPKTSKAKRDVGCPASPPGEPECCVPDKDALPTYEHTDEYGNTCACEYCRPPKYVTRPCVCTPGDPVGVVKCDFPDVGKTYMPVYPFNKCNNPFNCTTICPGNLTITEPCKMTKDAVCDCNESQGFYRSGDSTCSEMPRCDAKFKLERYHQIGSRYSSFRCVLCGIDEECGNEAATIITLRNHTGTTSSARSATSPSQKPVQETTESGFPVVHTLLIITICLFSVIVVPLFILVIWICRGQGQVRGITTNAQRYDFVPPNEENPETPV